MDKRGEVDKCGDEVDKGNVEEAGGELGRYVGG